MKSEGIKPDRCSLLAISTACNHAGLVDEGRWQLLLVTQDCSISLELEHYNCMIDILGRAGLVGVGHRRILDMPLKHDVVTWGALLSA